MPCRHSEVLAMARQPRPATMRAIAPTVARVGRRRMLGTTRATSRPISINIISGSTHIRETRDRRRSSRPWFDPDMPSPHAAFMSVYRRGKATARSAGTPRSFWTLRPLVPAAKETKDVALRYQRICRWVRYVGRPHYSNVPFGDYSIHDPKYRKTPFLTRYIHDYFFAKTLDALRPGGIMAFITSKGTMDKRDSTFRNYMASKADLLGAIRLPNTTF